MGLILHAGGEIDGVRYTNSREALDRNVLCARVVEVDVVRLRDGYGVAHDGFESRYGLERFDETDRATFLASRLDGRFTPLLVDHLADYPDTTFVLDFKADEREYGAFLEHLRRAGLRNVLPQFYCRSEYEALGRLGFRSGLLALWKHFDRDPLGDEALALIDHARRGAVRLAAVSLRQFNPSTSNSNLHDARVPRLLARGVRVYVHDQRDRATPRYFGQFAHSNDEFVFRALAAPGATDPTFWTNAERNAAIVEVAARSGLPVPQVQALGNHALWCWRHASTLDTEAREALIAAAARHGRLPVDALRALTDYEVLKLRRL